jgi:hypothetical protein
MKRGRVKHASLDFAFYGAALDNTPELELADPKSASPDTDLLVTEAMISCTSGMLLCLDREQRLTFILGAIFGVSDTVAAELGDYPRQLSPTPGPCAPRPAQLHERQVRTGKPREPLPVCQGDPWLHTSRPRRSPEPLVRSRTSLRGAGSRTQRLSRLRRTNCATPTFPDLASASRNKA